LKGTNSICSLKVSTELYWISLITLFTDLVALAVSGGGLCQQFLDKDFKQYVIVCKHAWQLKEDISNTYSNMQ